MTRVAARKPGSAEAYDESPTVTLARQTAVIERDTLSAADFMSDPARWVVRRMTVGEPVVAELPEVQTFDPAAMGLTYDVIVRPPFWRFALPPDADDDPRYPTFKRFDPQSVVLPDDASVTAFLDAATISKDELRRFCTSDADLATEWEHRKKVTDQKGVSCDWFLANQGPPYGTMTVPSEFKVALRDVLRYVRSVYAPTPTKPGPALTNAGGPTFASKNPPAKLVGGLLSGRDEREIAWLLREFAAQTGLDPRGVAGYGLSGRSGPMRKARPAWVFDHGVWRAYWSLEGAAQRNRVVQMGSQVWSLAVEALYDALEGGRRNIAQQWHPGDSAAHLIRAYMRAVPDAHHWEADISAYDTSVSPEIKDELLAAILEVWHDQPLVCQAARIWRMSERAPLIVPHLGLNPDHCGLLNAAGGWRSGNKLTSAMGNVMARAIGVMTLRRYGLIGKNDHGYEPSREVLYLSMGDDQRLCTRRDLDPALWISTWAELGFKCDLFAGIGFLSRKTDATYFNAPIGGRIIQQRLSNEHEDKSRAALGLALLGFVASTEDIATWQPAMDAEVGAIVTTCAAWVRDLGYPRSSASQLRRAIISDERTAGIIERALATKAGLGFIGEAEREAEHSVLSAAVLRVAARYGALDPNAALSLDWAVHQALAATQRLPAQERLSHAVRGYNACALGTREQAWLWADELTMSMNQQPLSPVAAKFIDDEK